MFLGIDLGTSEAKLLLLDDAQLVVGQASAPLQLSRPQPLWAEQAAGRLVGGHRTRGGGAARAPAAGLVAGACHRSFGADARRGAALDADDRPLRPAILWNDGRSGAECAELEAACPSLQTLSGNLAMPGFTAPKLLWVRKHEPELFARTDGVLLPKDWLRLMLTGERVSEMSDAAGTLWLDVAQRRWSPELLAATGLSEAQMPRLVEGSQPSGTLKPDLAARWGLGVEAVADVLVAGGGGDNAASAVGIGAVRPGEGFVSLGTSGVIFLTSDRFRPNPASAMHAFCHALPGTWHQMSVMLSAASCLRWFTQFCGAANEAELLAEIEQLGTAERLAAPLFLPYLAGERTPHNDPFASGLLFGLTAGTRRALAGYAVLEGVAFALADGLDALRAAGTGVQRLSLVGGGARSALWAQLIADALNLEIAVPGGAEAGAALGAARLAALASGADPQRVCRAPASAALHAPDPHHHLRLQPRLQRFRALYRQLQGLMAEQAAPHPIPADRLTEIPSP
jgi:xylulokinase